MLEGRAEFVGNYVGERSLAEAGRAVKKDVVERFAARFCGLNRYVEIFFDLVLADELDEPLRAELEFKGRIVLDRGSGDEAVFQIWIFLREWHCRRW